LGFFPATFLGSLPAAFGSSEARLRVLATISEYLQSCPAALDGTPAWFYGSANIDNKCSHSEQ
jgi:hypothetical protein